MFLSNLIIATAVLTISHHCFADNSAIRPFLNKPYHLVSSDKNFDLILKKLDINWIRRKAFEMAKPTLTLSWNPIENIYTLLEKGRSAKIDVSFQVGQVFIENTVDGRQVHDLFKLDGTKLKETQKAHGSPTLSIERKFSDDHVIVKIKLKDIISFRVYDAL